MKRKKGFTLVELLAVIVILAVILVIAVPRITDVINNSKKASFESSAKTIISQAEKKKMENEVLGNNNPIECSNIANINNDDYASCEINFDASGNAKITLIGKGKFEGLKIVNGTKDNLSAVESTESTDTAVSYITNLYNTDAASNNLKKDNTDDANIRYYGENPNNYVSFNDELWRIIGVFGNNVKLVRKDILGGLSWDTSESSVNTGRGINEWSEANLKEYLNTMYYGGTTVTCYNGRNNYTTTCPSASLNENAKSMIDNHIWNVGAVEAKNVTDTIAFYNAERGTQTGKICTSGDYCNDTITRTTSWTGYIALPYVTDWAYASSEVDCETNMQKQDSSNNYICKNNNWMHRSSYNSTWYLSPSADSSVAYDAWIVFGDGVAGGINASGSIVSAPALYLKSNVLIESGNGTVDTPYILKASSN